MSIEDFEVISNTQIAQNIWCVTIKCDEVARKIKPGQFMAVKVPGDKTQLIRCPFSLSNANREEGTIEIIYACVGDATQRMTKWEKGFKSNLIGPLGNGWKETDPKEKVLLVAGGVGITPILGLARYMGQHNVDFDCVVAARSCDFLAGASECEEAGASKVVVTTDDGSLGIKGYATDGVGELLKTNTYSKIYCCGPEVCMASVAKLAQANDIACEVSMERMMTCGFGACNTCNVAMAKGGYKACCKAGPVFDGCEVAW